jgi:hypothetical protein
MINQENLTEFVTIKLIIMKKLKKLQINHEKLMNNEELLKLRGGYSTWCCTGRCFSGTFKMSSTCAEWDDFCANRECDWFYQPLDPNCGCRCSHQYIC